MKKKYNPKEIEISNYNFWNESNFFKPNLKNNYKGNYCIMMPPPNITGELHLGHAFQQILMDILIRYHRMQGKNTLWMTGIDHAGIATQILIENYIYKTTGKIKRDYANDFLLKKIWEWKRKSEQSINYQMTRLGNSIDWSKKRFTMDPGFSLAVKEAFIRLYNNGLIYKSKRLVNWDYKSKTAISDLEVSHKQIPGFMWHIRYKLAEILYDKSQSNSKNYITVATTRPETIFGDTAIAVNPKDTRYSELVGKYVFIPIINRKIPIISDTRIDPLKGTGCVKITPAHDFEDYIIGKQHNLPMIKIFSVDRKILKHPEIFYNVGKLRNQSSNYYIPEVFQELTCEKARDFVISECDKLNVIEDTKTYVMTVPYNNRTGSIIEPMLTDQWYIRIKDLSNQAIFLVKNNIIQFIPKQYKNMYFKWMENIQDWCISRQICWGHEIPAWYDEKSNIYVGHSEKEVRLHHQLGENVILRKDTDVLDTWFSSSLWTFSSLGWPNDTNLLRIFHPTDVIISGFDIIFFWISRMIMMTTYLLKNRNCKKVVQIPFKKVYLTGLIRDEKGKKMSKSQGNTLDPLDIIDGISIENLLKKRTHDLTEKQMLNDIIKNTKKQFPNGIKPYGADSLRLTLTSLASSGRDIHWDMNRLQGYYNFCNKIWNVSRFVLMNTVDKDCGILKKEKLLSLPDQWITIILNQTIKKIHKSLENYRFDNIVNILYEFIWHQFCDWYIEFSKSILNYEQNTLKLRGTRYTLITSLEILLRLAHPVIPFITEEIWQKIKSIIKIDDPTIMLQSFPEYNDNIFDKNVIDDIEWIKSVISEIRMLRSYTGISYTTPLRVVFECYSEKIRKTISENNMILMRIVKLKDIQYFKNNSIHIDKALIVPLNTSKLFICIPKNFNKDYAISRFQKELSLIINKISITQQKLDTIVHSKSVNSIIFNKEQEKILRYKKIKNKLSNQFDLIKLL